MFKSSHVNTSQSWLKLQVVINALSPERLLGEDRQLSVVPSITHVYVSNDLQVGGHALVLAEI